MSSSYVNYVHVDCTRETTGYYYMLHNHIYNANKHMMMNHINWKRHI